jgi:transcriptional regulator with XRE-family HTH domain
MDAFARQFGAKIKLTRTERGMTQAELATAAEVGPNYVPRIERGEMTPSVDAAFRLSRALGLTLDDLCSSKGKRDPLGSASRQIAALTETDLAGMKRALDAIEIVRKALREPPAPTASSAKAKSDASSAKTKSEGGGKPSKETSKKRPS